MSVKAMSLVWDMECPVKINGKDFKSSHKYVLIAYADHADHNGRNIWPAMGTIAKKTGMDYRTVQRATKNLQEMGLLVEDGKGPRGTCRWKLPVSDRGDRLIPDKMTYDNLTYDKSKNSLVDNPSLDKPLLDKMSNELKELNQELINNISNDYFNTWENLKEQVKPDFKKVTFETWIVPTECHSFEDRTLMIAARNSYACNWLEENLTELAQAHLGVYVKFFVPELLSERMGVGE